MNCREAIINLGTAGLSYIAASVNTAESIADSALQSRKKSADPSLPPPSVSHPRHYMQGYGIPATRQQIAMLVYPNMPTLEMIGPHQILSRMGNIDLLLVGKTKTPVICDSDLVLQPTTTSRSALTTLQRFLSLAVRRDRWR